MTPTVLRIFQYISNKMQRYTVYLYLETALQVSGGTTTHHQERKQLYLQHLVFVRPLLLPAPKENPARCYLVYTYIGLHTNLTFMGPCIVRIFQYISKKTQRYTFSLYLETALHVSGGTSTHHQERIQLYLQHLVFVTPLLLSAAIVEELEPV